MIVPGVTPLGSYLEIAFEEGSITLFLIVHFIFYFTNKHSEIWDVIYGVGGAPVFRL